MNYKLVKRSFDLLSSSAALVILSPVFAFITAGIKFCSPGPVLYKSERVGLNGTPFTMLKFRSMHVKPKDAVESEYIVNNSRIFKFGSFLRKSKLDELPQLINILLSDMSVVGPRPYPRAVVDRLYNGEYRSILSVKPGLSCYDSLFDYTHGDLFVTDGEKYEKTIVPIRTELAKMYVEGHNFITDIRIILRTIRLIWEIVVVKKTQFTYSEIERKAVERVRNRMMTKSECR